MILRLKREAIPDADSTKPDPDVYPTPRDYQDTPTDTVTQDPDYLGHHHGDTGHSSAEGQGHMTQHSDTGSDPGYHSDIASQSDYHQGDIGSDPGFHSDMAGHGDYHQGDTGSDPGYHSDMAGQGDYSTSDPGQAHDSGLHSERYPSDMSGDYHNPLDMTRPGEAPPRYLSNVQHDHREYMPQALPLTQEPAPAESGQDGTQLDQGQGEMTADPGADGSSQDMPTALPQIQEFFSESGGQPIALPQKQG